MCTVTIIPFGPGVRLACNRDEARTRSAGLPPRIISVGARQALMPIDPVSGGTWIAVNDAGLIFALLNVHAAPKVAGAPLPRRSRGTIIPTLLEATTLHDALERTQTLNAREFAGFRLVIADRQAYAELYSTGDSCRTIAPAVRQGPLLFTSSGLGDALVEQRRRALFDEWFAAGQDWRERQDAFHRHAWPDLPHLSVCMRRPEACTVSCTIVECDAACARMTYLGDAPDQSVVPILATLNLAAS